MDGTIAKTHTYQITTTHEVLKMATYNDPFIRLTFGGQLADGQDEWNCGVNLAIINDAPVPILPVNAESAFDEYVKDMQDDMAGLVTAFFIDPKMELPRGVTLTYVKASLIGIDGKYIKEPHLWEIEPVQGPAARGYVPQVSLVISLQSQKFRDPGKWSRFYLPAATPISAGTWKVTDTQNKAVVAASFIKSLEAQVTTLFSTVIITPAAVTSSEKFEGKFRPIRFVKVGNVFDTQRRRRNKIQETYATVEIEELEPIPTPPEGFTNDEGDGLATV